MSCTNDGNAAKVSAGKDTLNSKRMSIRFDTLRVYGWGKELRAGGKFTTSFIWQDSSYLVTSGCKDSALHIFNFNDTSSTRSVRFPGGFDLCNYFACGYFQAPDKFFLAMRGRKVMRYDAGSWTVVADLKEYIGKDELSIREAVAGNEMFVKNDSLIYLPVKQYQEDIVKINYNEKSPETAELNIRSGKVNYTGISNPVELQLESYSLLRGTHQNFYNGKIFYFFDAVPEIWEYDMQGNGFVKRSVRSQYQKEDIKPINEKEFYDKDAWIKHKRKSGFYDKYFLYDPYRKCFYRFFTLPLSEKNAEGLFNTYQDARVSLMVLNENLEVTAEFLLPKKCFFVFYAAVSKEGLYINNGPVINSEKNGFPLLRISFPEN